jgi:D-sedoheptulose 7-phosphate isomerase
MAMEELILEEISEHMQTMEAIRDGMVKKISEFAALVAGVMRQGRKVLLMGNGGSAADAQHIAGEFVGRFVLERKGLPAIALTTDTSILTAVSNDYGFEEIFSQQVEVLADEGDVVVGISTSGNSPNVLKAISVAKAKGAKTVGLCGGDGGKLGQLVDLPVVIPVQNTQRIQEGHITIGHIVCKLVEEALFGKGCG